MDIYRNSAIIYSLELDEKSTYKEVIMGEQNIELVYNSNTFIDIKLGDYLFWNSQKFSINQLPTYTKKSGDEYNYKLLFESTKYDLSRSSFLFDSIENDFYIAGDAAFFVDLVILNMSRFGDSSWTKGIVVSTPIKNYQFQTENCWTALNKVCRDLEVEIDIVDKEINIRNKIGVVTAIELSYKNGLKSISSKPPNEKNLTTKIFAYGSDRNLPIDYGSKRLRVSAAENNVDLYGIWERTIIFDEIYPKFEGAIDSVVSELVIYDGGIDFDLNSQLIVGVKPKLHILDGGLAGYTFEITNYDDSSKYITLARYVDENGRQFPQTGAEFSAGDRYNFIDIEMPASYITNAESELEVKRDEYLDYYSNLQKLTSLSVEIDEKYLRDNSIQLFAGDTIKITDQIIQLDIDLRIASIIQVLIRPYMYRITLTDEAIIDKLIQLSTGQYNIEDKLRQLEKETRIIINS